MVRLILFLLLLFLGSYLLLSLLLLGGCIWLVALLRGFLLGLLLGLLPVGFRVAYRRLRSVEVLCDELLIIVGDVCDEHRAHVPVFVLDCEPCLALGVLGRRVDHRAEL